VNALPESMHRSMSAFYRVLGSGSAGGIVLERERLLAAVVPSCPNQSIVNAVVYEQGDAVKAAHDELREIYATASVRVWRLWVPRDDRTLREWLDSSGYRLSGSPRAMTLDLVGVDIERDDHLRWERTDDAAAVAALSEQAYGLPDGEFAEPLKAFADCRAHLYLAYEQAEPAACTLALDAGTDCGIYAVATRPSSRGRGLASALMRNALADARDRGCTTSSLQSSTIAFPVYTRLGYRDLGALDTWEYNSPDPAR
jgi:GNAT superfamily N-acetyltransferase